MIPLDILDRHNLAIYINIPYCPSCCTYCHYIENLKFGATSVPNDYLELLLSQLEMVCSAISGITVKSIYFGGGTPSLLTDSQIGLIEKKFDKYGIKAEEVSLELHPIYCNFNYEKNQFITRYSVAVQSFDDFTLLKYNRLGYSFSTIKKIFDLLRSNPCCKVINLDLIFDEQLPGNTGESINKLCPDTVTIYPNTKGRGVKRLISVIDTLDSITQIIPSYKPVVKLRHILALVNGQQSNYSRVECEWFGDIVGVGHNSVSYISDYSYLTCYTDNSVVVKCRNNKGSRYLSSAFSCLPFGVTLSNIRKYLPALLAGHYLQTVDFSCDINEKHTFLSDETLVYLPQEEYVRFIKNILPSFDDIYQKYFFSAIGYGDCDVDVLMETYNKHLFLSICEKESLLAVVGKYMTLKKIPPSRCTILIEGIDGSGKDTFARYLVKELKRLFCYDEKSSISIMGQPDSSLCYGKEAKNFIENLEYSSCEQVEKVLMLNRLASEEKIEMLGGICILIRGLVTDRATFEYAFQKGTQTLGEGQIIKKWNYYIVIDTPPEIADKRISKRGLSRTWREHLEHLTYFSNYYKMFNSDIISSKIAIKNTSLVELEKEARKLAIQIYADTINE